MRLKDKKAIVTGGGSGIGRGCALWLASEGADIAIPDINLPAAQKVAKEIEEKGRRCLAIQTDVSNLDQVMDMAQIVIK